jgi:hypothetical protein
MLCTALLFVDNYSSPAIVSRQKNQGMMGGREADSRGICRRLHTKSRKRKTGKDAIAYLVPTVPTSLEKVGTAQTQ